MDNKKFEANTDIIKKEWNQPVVSEIDIKDTKNGYINVDFEGPWNFLFGES